MLMHPNEYKFSLDSIQFMHMFKNINIIFDKTHCSAISTANNFWTIANYTQTYSLYSWKYTINLSTQIAEFANPNPRGETEKKLPLVFSLLSTYVHENISHMSVTPSFSGYIVFSARRLYLHTAWNTISIV